ncbi:MAG: hypothetical protein ABMA25_01505 [Ilumatobacteraceae bacterium]
MRDGVQTDGETVTIRNRWKSSELQIALLLVWVGAGVTIGVWVDSRADKGSKLPLLVFLVMAAGIAFIGRRLRRRGRRTAVLDRDGIRVTPHGPTFRWSEITMVRAVILPQQGYALAVVTGGSASVLVPTLTVRLRRLRTIRDACSTLSVLHPGVFLFDLLDEPSQKFPSADYVHRFSASSTQLLATRQAIPPVSESARRRRWVVLGLVVSVHLVLLVGQIVVGDESSSAPTSTLHFELTPYQRQQIEEMAAGTDLCHGFWTAPDAWPPDVAVTTIQYLRDDTVKWTLTAPDGGAVSFHPGGDLPSYRVNDVVESYGYTFVGTFTSTPFPPGDRLVLESPGRRLEVYCAEI